MPLYKPTQSYRPPFWLRSGHLNTIYSGTKSFEVPNYRRSVIRTVDDDFVIIDRLSKGFHQLAVLCHGLEGSSESRYMSSMGRFLHKQGYDILCINFRSCGGQINRGLRMYHSGETRDLHMVLKYHQDAYRSIDLIGFSLGGNVVLKYLGEDPSRVHHKVRSGIGISVPVDLAGTAYRLSEKQNYLYSQMFLKSLKEKMRKKARQFPNDIDVEAIDKVRTLNQFDEYFTGPLHGFTGAEDYYSQSSALQFLSQIEHPSLLLNAQDDPFLSRSSFPEDLAKKSENFHLYTPRYGGHVGFSPDRDGGRHHEKVVSEFLEDVVKNC